MFLASLFSQADYLRKQGQGTELEQVEMSLQQSLKAIQEHSVLPAGLTSAVAMTLTYAGFRHLHWINTPIFRDILLHHVSADFRIDTPTAALLTDAVLRDIRSVRVLSPSHVDNSDFEFLKYLFIIAATAENELSLIMDMGLGSEIIYKMKTTLQMVMTDPDVCEKSPKVFLSDLDAQIYEIMIEVSRDIRRYAWSIHVEKLRFLLIGVANPLSDLIARYGARWIFELLLSVGSKNIITSNQITARLQKNFMSADPAVPEDDLHAIVTQLHAWKLIFPVGGSRHNEQNYKWELAGEAARLTADAFAVTWLNAARKPLDGFRELNQHYQKSLIDCLGEGHLNTVKSLLAGTPSLAPEVMSAALRYLGRNESVAGFQSFISELQQSSGSGWAGRTVQKALQDAGLAKPG
jgi:hypothetical protein